MKWNILSAIGCFLGTFALVLRSVTMVCQGNENIYLIITFGFISIGFLFMGICSFYPDFVKRFKWLYVIVLCILLCAIIGTAYAEIVLINK